MRNYHNRRYFGEDSRRTFNLNAAENKLYSKIEEIQDRIANLDFVSAMKKRYSMFADMCEKLSELNEIISELEASKDDMEDEDDTDNVKQNIKEAESVITALGRCLSKLGV